MNLKVLFCLVCVCVTKAIAFEQYFYEEYDEPTTTDSKVYTTSTTTTTITTTTTSSPTPTIPTTTSFQSKSTSPTPVPLVTDPIKEGTSNLINRTIKTGGVRAEEGRENSSRVHQQGTRLKNCLSGSHLIKKIYEILSTSTTTPPSDLFEGKEEEETTMRFQRDYPNQYERVRNF
jgi:hypothetical protein